MLSKLLLHQSILTKEKGLVTSVFDRIKDQVKGQADDRAKLMVELCEHLRQIGVEATLLDQGSPEAIGGGLCMTGTVLGCIKIEGQNIDWIQVQGYQFGGGSRRTYPVKPAELGYQYNYVVRMKVEGFEDRLKVELKPIRKGIFSKESVGFKWDGGDLSQLLNDDSDLKNWVMEEGLNQLPNIVISPDKKQKCVQIKSRVGPWLDEGSWPRKFPPRKDFEAHNRIANHIRRIVTP